MNRLLIHDSAIAGKRQIPGEPAWNGDETTRTILLLLIRDDEKIGLSQLYSPEFQGAIHVRAVHRFHNRHRRHAGQALFVRSGRDLPSWLKRRGLMFNSSTHVSMVAFYRIFDVT
jgi:hypothetical protein